MFASFALGLRAFVSMRIDDFLKSSIFVELLLNRNSDSILVSSTSLWWWYTRHDFSCKTVKFSACWSNDQHIQPFRLCATDSHNLWLSVSARRKFKQITFSVFPARRELGLSCFKDSVHGTVTVANNHQHHEYIRNRLRIKPPRKKSFCFFLFFSLLLVIYSCFVRPCAAWPHSTLLTLFHFFVGVVHLLQTFNVLVFAVYQIHTAYM